MSKHLSGIVAIGGAALLLTGCSSSGSASSSASPAESAGGATSSAPTAAAQTVAMGASVMLPNDTVAVTAFTDNAVPKATKPDTPSTHWASAAVKQCATGDSIQSKWELPLADGSTANEPSSWIEGELTTQLQPGSEPLTAGDCLTGNVYFVVPDGAKATGVVLKASTLPARPQVTWTIG